MIFDEKNIETLYKKTSLSYNFPLIICLTEWPSEVIRIMISVGREEGCDKAPRVDFHLNRGSIVNPKRSRGLPWLEDPSFLPSFGRRGESVGDDRFGITVDPC